MAKPTINGTARAVDVPPEAPGGIGELGTAVTAPALANAVFAATGKRLRQLPLRPGPAA